MDVPDFKLFGGSKSKKSNKDDKADASGNKPTSPSHFTTYQKLLTSRPTDEDEYDCDHPNAGVALIFNHKNVAGQKQRVGTERDRDAMQQTLLNYGFDVIVCNDYDYTDINKTLKRTAKEDHSKNNCLIVVVMSHGQKGEVYASDMPYPVERLWNPFLGDNCRSLINKPKIFFIQACRGMNLDKAVAYQVLPASVSQSLPQPRPERPPTVTYVIPSTADILVMYSTFEKYYSFRNVENGSWFIQSLCNVLNKAALGEAASDKGIEFLKLLTAVNRTVAYEYQSNSIFAALNRMKQMPNFMSTLTKTFYLRVKDRKPIVNKEVETHEENTEEKK